MLAVLKLSRFSVPLRAVLFIAFADIILPRILSVSTDLQCVAELQNVAERISGSDILREIEISIILRK